MLASLDNKKALEGIIQGFSNAHGDFRTTISLFEILKECGLPNKIAPKFHLVGLSESTRSLMGFSFRADKLKLIPRNKNAEIIIAKMIQIARERKRRRIQAK
jgi:hypothetical protein